MVAPNIKGETKEFFERRASLEQQMNAIIARLSAPNGPGLSGNLLDHEMATEDEGHSIAPPLEAPRRSMALKGFPRADIDIPAVRSDRNRLAMLRNDHKDITAKIEQNLQLLLSGGLSHDHQTLPQRRTGEDLGSQTSVEFSSANSVPIPATSETSPTPMDEDAIARFPFAVVDEISDGSPATIDGLQLGDQILKFGTVEGGDNFVPRLAREGQINEGRAIPVVVIRRGVQVLLNVTPRVWSGRGLLGCHLQSL